MAPIAPPAEDTTASKQRRIARLQAEATSAVNADLDEGVKRDVDALFSEARPPVLATPRPRNTVGTAPAPLVSADRRAAAETRQPMSGKASASASFGGRGGRLLSAARKAAGVRVASAPLRHVRPRESSSPSK